MLLTLKTQCPWGDRHREGNGRQDGISAIIKIPAMHHLCLCSMAAWWCKGRRGSPRGAPRTTKVQYATDRVGRMPMGGIPLPTGVVKSTLSAELASQPSLSPPNLYKGEGNGGSLLGVQHLEREVIPFPHLDKQRTLDL